MLVLGSVDMQTASKWKVIRVMLFVVSIYSEIYALK